MSSAQDIAVRRAMAFCVDWLVVALWGGALFGVIAMASNGSPPRPATAWHAQLVGLVAMTVPFILYFATCESSARQASLGKRMLGLSVATTTGAQLSFRRAVARNTLKFLPWEFGHTVAHQAIFAGEGGVAPWVWATAAVAFACPIWWTLAILWTGRAPYDRWTSARVTRSRGAAAQASRIPAAHPGAADDDRRQAGDLG